MLSGNAQSVDQSTGDVENGAVAGASQPLSGETIGVDFPSVDLGANSAQYQQEMDDSVKLFVGQVPRTMEEGELREIMEKFGEIQDVVIIRDKMSLTHRGCAFVTYTHRKDADDAITKLHNNVTLPTATNPLQVRPADGQGPPAPEHKLFIGMIPKTAEEHDIREVFKPYGEIEEVYILRHQTTGQSKGCAFLKFKHRESAMAAIEHVHGQTTMEGGSTTLVVKLADSRRQRIQRARTQTASAAAAAYWQMPAGASLPFPQMQQQQQQYIQQMQQPYGGQGSGHGANMYYNPYAYNSYGYGGAPAYGFPPGGTPGEDTVAAAAAVASAAPGMVPGVGVPPGVPPSSLIDIPTSLGSLPRSSGQLEGPTGANLFIYHLPHDLTDADLATAFAPFGTVISAKVYMDKNTGESKGFGFVSYDSVPAADAAISSMNGFQIGSKRLKVQHKRVHVRDQDGEGSDSSHGSGTGADLGAGSDGVAEDMTRNLDESFHSLRMDS